MSDTRHRITASYKFHSSGRGCSAICEAIRALGSDIDAGLIRESDAAIFLSFIESSATADVEPCDDFGAIDAA